MTLAISARDVVGVAGAVGSLTMALGGGGLDAALVDDPFEGGAVCRGGR